ncbi:hypothetical protein SS50377_25835 [Spironucleus salmonicida]|uniref:Uncharacterized protein n=1 Tax=Spironucleus salmonicida TaxID=348837 RepID=V6LSV1_9EUKA|nr:hypothetical protein SS50377_25829 [Spironucleus salmonicida]KAH0571645.1 hypothetical protein SS50377_25835 [Spironucleus salmonicida]|eukprot:EST45411.1 Hypothetical protein SS50377_14643 [Spironucleus salmonicida]
MKLDSARLRQKLLAIKSNEALPPKQSIEEAQLPILQTNDSYEQDSFELSMTCIEGK